MESMFFNKKGSTYCTAICNADSHKPIPVLEGRDGSSLKEGIKKNKQVKKVTRDRASAYAKVIREEHPDTMQIADRFHVHQNLLEIIKKYISSSLPQTLRVEIACNQKTSDIFEKSKQPSVGIDNSKKSFSTVDNLTENEKKWLELLINIKKTRLYLVCICLLSNIKKLNMHLLPVLQKDWNGI